MAEARFCYACNEKYEVDARGALCPACGVELGTLPTPTDDFLLATGRQGLQASADTGSSGEEDRLPGRTLGAYAIETLAGKGGMARVYRARHLHLHRLCALKVLGGDSSRREPESVARFLSEARAAAALVHPNVVTIHNIDEIEGLHFIEMEFVEGMSLSRGLSTERRYGAEAATRLLVDVCAGLSAAHEQGIVHRDVKPSNVLVDRRGVAKIADFGLAKRLVGVAMPGAEGLAGTPHFMAPELFAGGQASARSDVYALGVTYFFLLAGRPPFAVSSLTELIRRHRSGLVLDLDELRGLAPPGVVSFVERCCARDPAARFADAGEALIELGGLARLLRSLDKLVELALVGLDAGCSRRDGCLVVDVPLEGERRQRVFVEERTSPLSGELLVEVTSPCAPVCEAFYRRALELNAEVHHGAIALERVDGVDHFVMRSAYPRASCDPEELRASILTVARGADEVENALTGEDVR